MGGDIRPGEGRLVPDSGESHYCMYSLVAVVMWQRRSRYGSKTGIAAFALQCVVHAWLVYCLYVYFFVYFHSVSMR